MRVADKMQFSQVHTNIAKNRHEMAGLQTQLATQKRLTNPSDDPLAATRVLGIRTEERTSAQFIKNINNAKAFLEFTDTSLGELTEILVRAKELALGQANDATANEQSRRVVGLEVEQIFNQAIQIGNRKLGDRHIFGGFKTETLPFDSAGNYRGDDGDLKLQISKDAFIPMNLPGSKVFLGQGLGGDGIARSAPETPKTVPELMEKQREEDRIRIEKEQLREHEVLTRRPAAYGKAESYDEKDPVTGKPGLNIFETLKGLEISLKTNDKNGIQESLDLLDQAINQVVLARSEVGARVMMVNHTLDTLQKAIVDNKVLASQLEDADVFQVVSDMNKADSALRATLETAPKLIQPSLLDFLR
ncbi:MAG: flagellar hook-associated protein FlgL [Bdellovibrionaceae bacterium]|nr:flagellar hook-associated protein FlgL [Pseudobdellovibrionaceae bacterium]